MKPIRYFVSAISWAAGTFDIIGVCTALDGMEQSPHNTYKATLSLNRVYKIQEVPMRHLTYFSADVIRLLYY